MNRARIALFLHHELLTRETGRWSYTYRGIRMTLRPGSRVLVLLPAGDEIVTTGSASPALRGTGAESRGGVTYRGGLRFSDGPSRRNDGERWPRNEVERLRNV